MNILFDIPESKSPRLIWIEKHGIWLLKSETGYEATAAGLTGKGQSEDDALVDMAKQMGIKLWNEL
jgi:hypothetical protein